MGDRPVDVVDRKTTPACWACKRTEPLLEKRAIGNELAIACVDYADCIKNWPADD